MPALSAHLNHFVKISIIQLSMAVALLLAADLRVCGQSVSVVVTNGDFQYPQVPAGIGVYSPSNGTWQWNSAGILSPPGFVPASGGYFSGPPAPVGDQYAFVQGLSSSISQNVDLPAQGVYRTSYEDAGRPPNGAEGVGGIATYAILLDSSVIGQSSTTNSQPFAQKQFDFAAPSGIHTLTFQITGASGDDTIFLAVVAINLT